jgi:DEAD/DEAH box helicase domain-containing protein
MLPSILAKQLEKGLNDYIETTFPMTNDGFKGTLDAMLKTKDSVFHEPYIAIKMPFRTSNIETSFEGVKLQYLPYLHQSKAYERLCEDKPKSTIVATGTGSGKTECFMYPALDYCYKHRNKRGIKILIIYPMNALATDQARRIAEEISGNSLLKGNITVGMYVGGREEKASMTMGKNTVITDHETLLSNPPDILMTNYKMLDYLLVRPKDASLWKENDENTLKYIIVDELHTFDGAQGTDLSCLIRRLKDRLGTPKNYMCCVGTSATIGSGDSQKDIIDYATEIFGEQFDKSSVIVEDRLKPEEFFNLETNDFTTPTNEGLARIFDEYSKDNFDNFIKLSVNEWISGFDKDPLTEEGRVELGKRLLQHNFVKSVLSVMQNRYVQNSYIIEQLQNSFPFLLSVDDPTFALDTLFAIISHARSIVGGKIRPLLTVSVQLWLRELRRVVATVSNEKIEYALATDLNENQAAHYLPVINCRDCGATGWASIIDPKQTVRIRNLELFYNAFFAYDDNVTFLYPRSDKMDVNKFTKAFICPDCMQLDLSDEEEHQCSSCGSNSVPVFMPLHKKIVAGTNHKHYLCPHCGSKSSLSLVGLRSATTISASISQLFSSKFNDDKKTLTFSDNVQDAAHRAGFFSSRTWRFCLRSAIQAYVNDGGNGQSLFEFQNGFINYWKNKLTVEEYVSLFIPNNLMYMQAYETMLSTGKYPNDNGGDLLLKNIDDRLKYEILLEYGLMSRIGRTLEKTCSSTLSFDNDRIIESATNVKLIINNEENALIDIDESVFQQLIVSMLNRIKYNGAFNDETFTFYLQNGGNDYFLTNDFRKWMPGKSASRNIPEFLYKNTGLMARANKNFCDIRSSSSKYLTDILSLLPLGTTPAIAQVLFEKSIEQLVKNEVLSEIKINSDSVVYAINTKTVKVVNEVSNFLCDDCGQSYSFSKDNSIFWNNNLCPSNNCYGRLKEDIEEFSDYYHNLYNYGDIKRIVSKEHTGLLSRSSREGIEKEFKHKKEEVKPWDINVLSCTPTLEMGIDIGSLSTVILCSMPPAQSQYLQRVGRAGRKDGNALTLTIANAKPHDLYFYASPLDMIEGNVSTPKVFLDASAVLQRQFLAYGFDNWVKSGVAEDAIPKNLGISLSKLKLKDTNYFPFNFLKYVQDNLNKLLVSFFKLFPEVSELTKGEIQIYSKGDGISNSPMYMKIFEAFELQQKEIASITKSIKDLTNEIKHIESLPSDPAYEAEKKELESERKALGNVVKDIRNKDVMNFLSDEGLLPNYAFPESGVTLKAILKRKTEEKPEEEENKKTKRIVYEYNRTASSAISEFAPLNNFYAEGRKLTIDQVDLASANIAKWRLCPNCSHAELEVDGHHTSCCPQCGAPGWADSGQLRSMLKVQMVYSNMKYEDSLIGDESDDRKVVFYNKQLLVDVDEEHDITKAYRMDNAEFPFGYEFVKKATIREINYGEAKSNGEKTFVSGVEDVRKGFKICKHCGKIQIEGEEPKHTYACKARKGDYNPDDYEDCLFLYRELTTEALRLLIPSTTLDSSRVRTESFEAAFMLGMKEYFGNVEHLKTCICEAPVQDSEYRKQYLVVYDSVPGGTGYLKQLLQNDDSLIEIFKKAIDKMEKCSCNQDSQKDGCYHCLYGYRQSHNIGTISRTSALNMLKAIVSGKDNLQVIDKLSNIPVNSLFDSELEKKFIEALALLKTSSRNVVINKDFVNNKEGYILKIGDCRWEIEPQVELGKAQGVSINCKPDFVLWPDKELVGQKPVAVFTDGFAYHKNKTWDDTLKREAIRRSGRFRVWSFTFKDVQDKFKALGDYTTQTLLPSKMPSGNAIYNNYINTNNAKEVSPSKVSTFDLFAQYLENKNAEKLFEIHAYAYSWSLLNKTIFKNNEQFNMWKADFNNIADQLKINYEFTLNNTMYGVWIPSELNSSFRVFSGIDVVTKFPTNPYVLAELQDNVKNKDLNYEKEWNGFWNFYNVMQFSSFFYGVSTIGINSHVYNTFEQTEESSIVSHEVVDAKWNEILENLYDEQAKIFASECIKNSIIAPDEVGNEIDEDGIIIGECEMLWKNSKMVYLTQSQLEESEKAFIDNGYIIIKTIDDAVKNIGGK